MAIQIPMCITILLCDAIRVDPTNGKRSIIGEFEMLVAKRFPARQAAMIVFAELTDGRGQVPITLRICRITADDPDGIELTSVTVEFEFPEPRVVVPLFISVSPLDLPAAGEYHFVLESNGAFIARRRLTALLTVAE